MPQSDVIAHSSKGQIPDPLTFHKVTLPPLCERAGHPPSIHQATLSPTVRSPPRIAQYHVVAHLAHGQTNPYFMPPKSRCCPVLRKWRPHTRIPRSHVVMHVAKGHVTPLRSTKPYHCPLLQNVTSPSRIPQSHVVAHVAKGEATLTPGFSKGAGFFRCVLMLLAFLPPGFLKSQTFSIDT